MDSEQRLVVVSNRVPSPPTAVGRAGERTVTVGGLVNAVQPVLEQHGGLWFGWSGRGADHRIYLATAISNLGKVQLATLDLSEDEVSGYYTGFSNRTLWPLLHSFVGRTIIRRDYYGAYRRINGRFAEALHPLLKRNDTVWVQDFHLFLVGQELRRMGWEGRIGFFLHVPFPSVYIFAILPWAREILEGLMQYDLVGFQTKRDLHHAIDALESEVGGSFRNGVFVSEDASVRLGVYPIGIEPSPFQPSRELDTGTPPQRPLTRRSSDYRIILGVDRLDYTKGIPERLRAFERLLEHNPSLRGSVSFVQISSPSRTRVPEYTQVKEQVEGLVGQINGRFSEARWVPIRYLYRSYEQQALTQFYRDADVGLVTPLRDGMNLVAKEFVASQDEDDPGVLVLSRFCGSAESMPEALIVNPYDTDGTATAINQALRMPKQERQERWRRLMDHICSHTAQSWCDSFLQDLAASEPAPDLLVGASA